MSDGLIAGGGGDFAAFSVQPAVLTAYADSIQGEASTVGTALASLGAAAVPRCWFGSLPQSGQLADDYGAHREALLADLEHVVQGLLSIAEGLERTAARYCSVDEIVAVEVEACGASEGR